MNDKKGKNLTLRCSYKYIHGYNALYLISSIGKIAMEFDVPV